MPFAGKAAKSPRAAVAMADRPLAASAGRGEKQRPPYGQAVPAQQDVERDDPGLDDAIP